MGNTQARSPQYASAYTDKRYEAIVNNVSGEVVALKDKNTKEIIPAIEKVANDLSVYINSNNAALVAVEDRVSGVIRGVAAEKQAKIDAIIADLATQGTSINTLQLAFDTYTKSTAPDAFASKTFEATVTQQGRVLTEYGARLDTHDSQITSLQQSLEGKIVEAGKVSNDALTAYITLNDNKLVAMKDDYTNQITAAAKLSSDDIQRVATELAAEGVRITGVATTLGELQSQVNTIEANLLALTTSFNSLRTEYQAYVQQMGTTISGIRSDISGISTNLSDFQQTTQQFHDNLKSNYNFNKFSIGNGWYLQPQNNGSQDFLCIGKGAQTLMCLDTRGELNYDQGSYGVYSA